MIQLLFVISSLSFHSPGKLPVSRNNASFIADDSSKQVKEQLTASIRQLHPTHVIRLFPQIMNVCPAVAFTIPCIPPVGA